MHPGAWGTRRFCPSLRPSTRGPLSPGTAEFWRPDTPGRGQAACPTPSTRGHSGGGRVAAQAALRTTEHVFAQLRSGLQGSRDLAVHPGHRGTGSGMRRGGLQGLGLQGRPFQTPLPRALCPAPSHPQRPPRHAGGVCKGGCGAPERTPLSLRDLTTALPNIGDLLCLSLHILTSAFLRGAAPRGGCHSRRRV